MLTADIKQWIKRELPVMFRDDVEIHQFILDLTSGQFADKRETTSRFDQVLEELRRNREADLKKWEEQNRKWDEQNRKWDEQNRKWDEHLREEKVWRAEQNRKWEEQNRKWDEHLRDQKAWRAEQNRRWEEQNRKWEEQNRKWDENQKTIQQVLDRLDRFSKKFDSSIGAIGSRWGFQAEEAFRSALKSILEQSFDVEVLNITEFDESGDVFGQPDQVELDVIIKNGLLLICELKSSMSRGDVYIFHRKVRFYERLHQCTANRRIIVTPMIRDDARRVAAKLDIEVYSWADDVKP